MLDLKHEALRERHWQQIIRETNVEIDLSSNVLILDNIFQMNLHQYQEIIQSNRYLSCKETKPIECIF